MIGRTTDGEIIEIDVRKLTGSHGCVIANAGAGKSGLLRRILETTHGHIQQIIIDVEDEFYTLRERYEYIIAGGEGADCPATPATAASLAKVLLTTGVSAVIQLNDLQRHEQEEFIRNFVTAMMEAPRALWHPVLIVLDEAHRMVPQEGYTACSDAVRDLTARGRKRGFTVLLASQRMAKINKNVTGDVNNWFLGRVGQATDRRVAAEHIGFSPNSPEGRSLQSLPTRQFWTLGTATTSAPTLFTVDQTETTMVQAGGERAPTPPTPSKLKGLFAQIAQEARQTASKATGSPTPGTTAAAVEPLSEAARAAIFDEGRVEGYKAGEGDGRTVGIRIAVDEMVTAVSKIAERYGAFPLLPAPDDVPAPTDRPAKARAEVATQDAPAPTKPPRPAPAPRTGDHVGAMKLVEAAGTFWPIKMTWVQVCTANGNKARGGHFNTSKKVAIDQGWLADENGRAILTAAGQEKIGWKKSRKDPLEVFLSVLPHGAARALETLIETPAPLTREQLAEKLGVKPVGGHWNTTISTLRNNDLLEPSVDQRLALAGKWRR